MKLLSKTIYTATGLEVIIFKNSSLCFYIYWEKQEAKYFQLVIALQSLRFTNISHLIRRNCFFRGKWKVPGASSSTFRFNLVSHPKAMHLFAIFFYHKWNFIKSIVIHIKIFACIHWYFSYMIPLTGNNFNMLTQISFRLLPMFQYVWLILVKHIWNEFILYLE